MLLQIKTSKVCARTEGRMSGYLEFYMFESEAVILFFDLCNFSDKFPKMFGRSCGMECPSTANFCHQCGQQLNLSQVLNKAVRSVDNKKLLKKYLNRGYP